MKTSTVIMLVIGIVLFGLGLLFGVSYFAYWLVLKAGAPKYVAVIVGIAVAISGVVTMNFKSSKR